MNTETNAQILARYAGIRVLVLGATGFIGRWVGRLLTEARADLICAVRDPHRAAGRLPAFGATGEHAVVELKDSTQIARLVETTAPTVTFNCAGYGVLRHQTDPEEAHRINVSLPETLVSWSDSFGSDWNGTRLIHIGSAAEYGNAGGNLTEDGPASPISLYGETKLQGTLAVTQAAKPSTAVGRLFTVYGAGEDPARLFPSLLAARETTGAIELTAGLQRRDFTHARDAAMGLLRMGCHQLPAGAVINLASGLLTSVRSFVQQTASEFGISPSRLEFGALPTRGDEMSHLPVSTARCRELLDWIPSITIEEGARLTLDG